MAKFSSIQPTNSHVYKILRFVVLRYCDMIKIQGVTQILYDFLSCYFSEQKIASHLISESEERKSFVYSPGLL